MDVAFADDSYQRLEVDGSFNAGFAAAVVSAFRKRMQQIRAARDERDLYAIRSLVYKKLQGERSHQKSMRLNDQWRLIVEVRNNETGPTIFVIGVEDYH